MLADVAARAPRALRVALWLVVAAYVAYGVWAYAEGYGAAARGERPLYTDFTPTYAAALVLRELPADYLYNPRAMREGAAATARIIYGEQLTDQQVRALPFTPWLYPPTFNFVLEPLARLPYLGALALWFALTLPLYLVAMRRMLPGDWVWPVMLAMPPVFLNAMYGQTGFLTAGLLGLGLCLLVRAPVWAGVLIGLASLKPHLGILFPLALAAGGHWRVFGAAAVTVIGLVVASIVVYGLEPWLAYGAMAGFHLDGFSANAYNFVPMVSVLAGLKTLGVSLDVAWGVQMVISAAMAALVCAVWWRGRGDLLRADLQAVVLLLATVLAVPMVYLYDLVVLVPVCIWLWADGRRHGAAGWEFWVLFGGLCLLLPAKAIAAAGVPVGLLVVVAWLALALRRWRHRANQMVSSSAKPDAPLSPAGA